MLDIVINHTSTEHQWFKEGLVLKIILIETIITSSLLKMPSNHWESKFGGNAWQYDEKTDEYYLHLFDVTQADLNWNNEKVRQSYMRLLIIDSICVDGFRFDVINLISKGEFKDSPQIGKEFYTDGPRVHEYLHELNRHTFGDKRYDDGRRNVFYNN